jgi:alkylresorcinol/alkylpyrone synthase
LTFQRDDLSTAGAVATSLFGDAAAAAVLIGEDRAAPTAGTLPRLVGSRSLLYENTEDVVGWRFGEHGFGVVLRTDVPEVVARNLRRDVDAFLARLGLQADDIGIWLVHPGGPRVLRHVTEALSLPPDALQRSWDSLRTLGNVSSASVLLMLADTLESRPPRGTYALIVGMGPGFSVELLLLRWE